MGEDFEMPDGTRWSVNDSREITVTPNGDHAFLSAEDLTLMLHAINERKMQDQRSEFSRG